MISQQAILTQNKILGVLLRKARLEAGRTVQDCAQVLGCDPAIIDRAEQGTEGLSLPQLESLAHILDVPFAYLVDPSALPEEGLAPEPVPYREVVLLRSRIVGVILRQTRQEAGRTLDELGALIGCTPEHLGRVELGEAQLSFSQLQALADALGIPLQEFTSKDVIPLSEQEQGQRDLSLLAHLPAELREFVLKPINIPYLQVAMNLSEMPADTLRQIASGLLEITY